MVNGAPREVLERTQWSPQATLWASPSGLPSKNLLGAFNILPRGSIHHDTPSAYPQIVPVFIPYKCLLLSELKTSLTHFGSSWHSS